MRGRHVDTVTLRRKRTIRSIIAVTLAAALGFGTMTYARAADMGPEAYPGHWTWSEGRAPSVFVGGSLQSDYIQYEGVTVVGGDFTSGRQTELGLIHSGTGIAAPPGTPPLRVGGSMDVGGQRVGLADSTHQVLMGGEFNGRVDWGRDGDVMQGDPAALGDYADMGTSVSALSAALAAPEGAPVAPAGEWDNVVFDGAAARSDGTSLYFDYVGDHLPKKLEFRNIDGELAGMPIVVNVRGESAYWPVFDIRRDGGRANSSPNGADADLTSRLVWNFPNASYVELSATSAAIGMILVPRPDSFTSIAPMTVGTVYTNGNAHFGAGTGGMGHYNRPTVLPTAPDGTTGDTGIPEVGEPVDTTDEGAGDGTGDEVGDDGAGGQSAGDDGAGGQGEDGAAGGEGREDLHRILIDPTPNAEDEDPGPAPDDALDATDRCPPIGDYPPIRTFSELGKYATDNNAAIYAGGDLDSKNAELEGLTVVRGNATLDRKTRPHGVNVGVAGEGSGIFPANGESVLRVGGNLTMGTDIALHVHEDTHTVNIGGTFTGRLGDASDDQVITGDASALAPFSAFEDALGATSAELAGPDRTPRGVELTTGKYWDTVVVDGNAPGAMVDGILYYRLDASTVPNQPDVNIPAHFDFRNIPENTPVVINVTGRNINWNMYQTDRDGQRADGGDRTDGRPPAVDGDLAGAIVWNITEASILKVNSSSVLMGTVLAPHTAKTTVATNSNGRIYVGGDLTLASQAWGTEHHNYPWILPKAPGQCDGPPAVPTDPSGPTTPVEPDPIGVPIQLTKTLDGTGAADLSETFAFSLTASDPTQAGLTAGESTTTVTASALAGANDGTLPLTFGGWTFAEGNYDLELREVVPDPRTTDLAYDETVYRVNVAVTRTGDALSPAVTIYRGDEAVEEAAFTNTYSPAVPDPDPGRAALVVDKVLTGDAPPAPQTFAFTVAPRGSFEPGAITMPAAPRTSVELERAGTRRVTFPEITFHKAGTYRFTLSETPGTLTGMAYDRTPIIATVTVEPVDGVLEATAIEYTDAEGRAKTAFTNTFALPKPVELPISFSKAITGTGLDADTTFTFDVASSSAGLTPGDATATITAAEAYGGDRTVTVPGWTVSAPGMYTVTVAERPNPGVTGLVNDAHTLAMTWNVTLAADNTLSVGQPTVAGSRTFTNTYAKPAPATIELSKTLRGETLRTPETFSFTLGQSADNPARIALPTEPVRISSTAAAAPAGAPIRFDGLVFDTPGTYSFTVTESGNGTAGLALAPPVPVTVDVARTAAGPLTATVSYPEGTVMENRYMVPTPTKAPVALSVQKSYSGDYAPEESFTFTMAPKGDAPAGAYTLPATSTASTGPMDPGEGTATFGEIVFNTTGTFEFTITEDEGTTEGLTYDKRSVTATVTVTRDDGALDAAVAYEGGATAERNGFTNTYEQPAPRAITAPVSATKILDATPPTTEEFRFDLRPAASYKGVTIPTRSVTVSTDDLLDGTERLDFGRIGFTAEGEYTFTISEAEGSHAGITYDPDALTVTVVVTHDRTANTLSLTTTYSKAGRPTTTPTFVNTYADPEPGTLALEVDKTYRGEQAPDRTFTFEVAQRDDDAPRVELPPALTSTFVGGSTQKVAFPEIAFPEPGTYVFEITEVAGTDPSITYDPQTITATVDVRQTWPELTPTVRYSQPASFTNTYQAPATVSIPLTKTLAGETIAPENEFAFTLTPKNTNPAPVEIPETTATVTAGDAVKRGGATTAFEDLVFHVPGTYEFTIAETRGGIVGMDYAGAVTATVRVTGAPGRALEATVVAPETLTMSNTYRNPNPTSDTVTFTAHKDYRGQGAPAADFTFEMWMSDGDPAGVNLPAGMTTTVPMAGPGTASSDFNSIEFTATGTYEFQIWEHGDNDGQIDYAGNTVHATVVVTREDGALKATTTYLSREGSSEQSVDRPVFVNTWIPNPGEIELEVSKDLTGATPLASTPFTFTATSASGSIDDPAPVTITMSEVGTATVGFSPVTVREPGTYTFLIEEARGAVPGMHYDPEPITATAVVEPVDGTLQATSVTYVDGEGREKSAFTNTYTRHAPVDLPISFQKKLIGAELDRDTTFVFDVSGAAAGLTTGETTATIAAGQVYDGEGGPDTVTVDGWQATDPGRYTVTVSERPMPGIPGLVNDSSVLTFTWDVSLGDDNVLVPGTPTVTRTAGDGETDAVFTNTYTRPATASVEFSKSLTGETLPAGGAAFRFAMDRVLDIEETNGLPVTMPTDGVRTITADEIAAGDDSAEFTGLTFQHPGDYHFRITEQPTGIPGMRHAAPVDVTIRVTQTDAGPLRAEVVSPETLTFTNHYMVPNPRAAGVSLEARKTLDGEHAPSETYMFEARLAADSPDSLDFDEPLTAPAEMRDALGQVTFDLLEFTEEGTWVFDITEVAGPTAGMDYDRRTVRATVTVDRNDGTLVPSVIYEGGAIVQGVANGFVNTYEQPAPDPLPVPISVTKTLDQVPDGEWPFVFTLEPTSTYDGLVSDHANRVTLQAGALADGSATVDFGDVTFTQSGTYVFTVQELKGAHPGIAYDTVPIMVTVVVDHDVRANTLSATTTYERAGSTASAPVIANRYADPLSVPVVLEVDKTWTGTDAPESTFAFRITRTDSNGQPIGALPSDATVRVGRDDTKTAAFGAIEFSEPGVYTFDITEVQGTDPSITYDAHTVTATVTIEETWPRLTPKVSYSGSPSFTNTYAKPRAIDLPFTKELTGETFDENETFTFKLTRLDNEPARVDWPSAPISTTSPQAVGGVELSFKDITFYAPGDYSFAVSEINNGTPGMTYADDLFIDVAVTALPGGALEAVTTYRDGSFMENVYRVPEPGAATAVFEVDKVYEGDGAPAEVFVFDVKRTDSNRGRVDMPMSTRTTLPMSMADHDTATFNTVTFHDEGSYTFDITESDTTATPGMHYDTRTITAAVNVTRDDGTLHAHVSYLVDGEPADPVFTNLWEDPEPEVTEESEEESEDESEGGESEDETFKDDDKSTDDETSQDDRTSEDDRETTGDASGTRARIVTVDARETAEPQQIAYTLARTQSGPVADAAKTAFKLAKTGAEVIHMAAAAGSLLILGLVLARRRSDGE